MSACWHRGTLSMSEVIRSKRGQAVLISLQNDPDFSRGQNAPVERFEWRRPLRQRNGRTGRHERRLFFAQVRGLSSAGRASALQAEGHRFDPDRLHQGNSGCVTSGLRPRHTPRNDPPDRLVRRSRNGMWVGSSGG